MTRASMLDEARRQKIRRLGRIQPSMKAHEIAREIKCPESTVQHWLKVFRREGVIPRYRASMFNKYADNNDISDTVRRMKEREKAMNGDKMLAALLAGRSFAGA